MLDKTSQQTLAQYRVARISGAILEPWIAHIVYLEGNIRCGSLSSQLGRPQEAGVI